ncbi:hypothetical protein AB0M46_51225, partial [Dactylosporangium sp. NPDC051485]|uniref:hypothetical protein n=1 Tax=Dactylosporangium sp. NPDC051485 TaxID=3154846 RepID=UPI00343655B1
MIRSVRLATATLVLTGAALAFAALPAVGDPSPCTGAPVSAAAVAGRGARARGGPPPRAAPAPSPAPPPPAPTHTPGR